MSGQLPPLRGQQRVGDQPDLQLCCDPHHLTISLSHHLTSQLLTMVRSEVLTGGRETLDCRWRAVVLRPG